MRNFDCLLSLYSRYYSRMFREWDYKMCSDIDPGLRVLMGLTFSDKLDAFPHPESRAMHAYTIEALEYICDQVTLVTSQIIDFD